MKLYGLDAGINDNARSRGIVFHRADYVKSSGAGRSWGRHYQPLMGLCRGIAM